jgi:hypothetical protein
MSATKPRMPPAEARRLAGEVVELLPTPEEMDVFELLGRV